MREEILPLFPLPLVLFPRTALPLHIFEERYREMIGEAIEARSEFGVVLAREGGVVNTGCTATVERVVQRYADGRFDILTAGRRRFEIHELVEGRSFLRGRVSFFDDEELSPPDFTLRLRAVEGFRKILRVTHEEIEEPKWDDPQLSFQLAQIVTDVDFRQQLLCLRSEVQRLETLVEYYPVYLRRWSHTEQIRAVAPRNGHSKIIPFEAN
ncbi:MAG: LON peptidase substrate-binding domain-containing protein [Bryobacteraceae bacterium]|nr:LON peptidase substrate-binding domain-containing protein [Bryobacteraceae bacterium]MDW8378530.1 LON peptidase substrate-binding domain-containing protein [Bryobacterales bacterium]